MVTRKRQRRMTVDIAMAVLLPMLMAYSLIGETFHEVIGTVIFVLFIIHHIQNRRWYAAAFRGKYDAARIVQTVLDTLLLVFMIAQPVSGILMSRHLYTFIHLPGASSGARALHMFLAYWGYILMCMHMGMHLYVPLRKLAGKHKTAGKVLAAASAAVSVYGVCAFIKRQFPGYMFRRIAFAFFDYSEPRIFFFLDYLAVMVLFAAVGCLVRAASVSAKTAASVKRPG